ncbi:MAG TPA: MarR family transcriptional regulator [Nocardioidaceae bacterium]|nr:MarR family transcriptional regulator [Nocardioidaceae bacterium]
MSGTSPAVAELAGGLRTAVVRLHHWLQAPVARRGVTPTRLTAMAILEKTGPLRAGDLADRLTITAPSMSRLAEALEEGGWVRREPDPEDRRAQLIALSDDGKATLDLLRREGTGELADALGSLPRADREALERALPVLVRLSDVMGEPRREVASAGRHA